MTDAVFLVPAAEARLRAFPDTSAWRAPRARRHDLRYPSPPPVHDQSKRSTSALQPACAAIARTRAASSP
jgi:hypothetical protein